MTTQTLTIGKRRFALLAERDFLRLQKNAEKITVRSEFAEEAMQELKTFRKTRRAANWSDVKRKLTL